MLTSLIKGRPVTTDATERAGTRASLTLPPAGDRLLLFPRRPSCDAAIGPVAFPTLCRQRNPGRLPRPCCSAASCRLPIALELPGARRARIAPRAWPWSLRPTVLAAPRSSGRRSRWLRLRRHPAIESQVVSGPHRTSSLPSQAARWIALIAVGFTASPAASPMP